MEQGVRTVIPYKPRPLQLDFHNKKKRWNLLVCHRRFGKTVMTINQLLKDASLNKLERPRYAYIAPTYKMAKSIVWDYLKHYSSVIPQIKFNESELRIDLPNGARIILLGADKPDALRGIYLDGVVLDEFAQIRPNLFTEIIRPTLADRKGYAIFIGTPQGKNHFSELYEKVKDDEDWYVAIHKASETKYVDAEELKESRKMMTEDEYLQEFECSWTAAIRGAFYADDIAWAIKENRVCKIEYDKRLKVHTFWDIGYRDDTSIIFAQVFGKEVRIIDGYSNSGMTLADYAQILGDKGYNYGDHYFPWDAKIKPMSSGKSTIDVARDYGIEAKLTPSLSILEGINQARLLFPQMWFNEEGAKDLLNALTSYRREYDDKKQSFRASPLHDWSSHYADAFRYMAISINQMTETPQEEYNEAYNNYVSTREVQFNF